MLEIFKCLRNPFMSLHNLVMILIQASAALHYLLFFYMNFALLKLLSQFPTCQDAQIGQSK